jgi:hypothetical protein
VFKNGVYETLLGVSKAGFYWGSTGVYLNAGEYIDLRPDASINTGSSVAENWVYIERLSGPSQIAASELIAASYSTNTGTVTTGSTSIVVYGTKRFDTHGFYNPSTGVATAPSAGKFRVTAHVNFDLGAAFTGNSEGYRMFIYKNGAQNRRMFWTPVNGNAGQFGGGLITGIIDCIAGDTLDVRFFQDSGASVTFSNNSDDNVIDIERIGK